VQVNLAMPAANPFATSTSSPTGASVLVDTDSGEQLSGGEVQAIVHLVASSVPGLSANDVTVADSQGDLLAGPGVNNSVGSNGNATSSFNASQQAKIASYLASVLGAGNAEIQVNALLNFDQVSTTTNGFQTGANGTPITVPTQTSTSTQTATGGAGSASGTLGTTATTTPGSGNYSNTSSSSSFSAGTVTKTDTTAPGQVESQSIAVLVNTKSMPKGVSLSTLKDGVAAAAGLTPSRGDTLVMSEAPFSTASQAAASKAAAAAQAAESKQGMSSLIRTGVLALAVALVLFLLWRSAKKNRVPRRTPMIMPMGMVQTVDYDQEDLELTVQTPFARSEVRAPVPDRSAEMANFIDSQPSEVAALLRAWTKDRHEPSAVGRG
jgi:flagellar M-ring protein FliF